jgi:CheY-like chemotaxis protein
MQVYDVLVSNVNLPGIDGIELLTKAKSRNPGLKVILVANGGGEVQPEVMAANADAIYYKKDGIRKFSIALKHCLGLEQSTQDPVEFDQDDCGGSVSNCIEKLQQVLGSSGLVLFDSLGRIQAQAGEIPEASVVLPLMAVFSSVQRLGRFLKKASPGNFQYFPGVDYDLYLAIMGSRYLLVAFVPPSKSGDEIGKTMTDLYQGASKLEAILLKIGIELEPESQPVPEKVVVEEEPEDNEPALEALFREIDKKVPKAKDVDAFWDAVAAGETPSVPQNADALTYDQALQLGFGPDGESE